MRNATAFGTATVPTLEDACVPWAAALNTTAEHDEITVTLLSLAVVDDQMRLTGLLRVRSRPDVRVATIPSLEVAMPGGTALRLVDARVQPRGRVTWVSWTYEWPEIVPGRLEGRIDHIELEYRLGGTARVDVLGPWDFSFPVRPPTEAEIVTRPEDRMGMA
jgi:hypothetical protein